MKPSLYLSLLAQARRKTRRADEAEDLLHNALLAAVEAGRADLSQLRNRKWLAGVLRNQAALDARSALRRRSREIASAPLWHLQAESGCPETTDIPRQFIDGLPPSLRSLALLALTGHSRTEIGFLLRISDVALRQRVAQLRRQWRAKQGAATGTLIQPPGPLPFGLIRRALLRPVRQGQARLGSHDPDGHLFVLGTAHKMPPRGNIPL